MPRYQRGYRWTRHEVEQLLNDVKANGDSPYSLQPIVVKTRGDGSWELIDGQQRLTTLFLVLRYMEREGLKSDGPRYTITYETRPGSAAFLRDPDPARRSENIDFHHIFGAYEAIREWFERLGRDRQLIADDIYRSLLRHVKVVWYVAPPDVDSTLLFTRLNVGRIPLNDAELLKALLLTRLRGAKHARIRPGELAEGWDRVEADLRDRDLWAFISKDAEDERPTRIAFLLDVLAGRYDGLVRPPFHTFDRLQDRVGATTDSAEQLWQQVLDLHGLLMGWYADRGVFHKVGYLVAIRVPFAEMVELARGCTKSAFEQRLVKRIRDELALSAADIRELSYLSERDRKKMRDLLLLMNVETVSARSFSTERYPFHQHHAGAWSLEHIHAQHSEGLTRAEQWEAWRVQHLAAVRGLPPWFEPTAREQLITRLEGAAGKLDRKTFPQLGDEVGAFFTAPGMADLNPEYGLHGIANMALLSKDDNAALNNAAFEVKRRRILRMDRDGRFLPVSTRQVFLKYYSDGEGQQLHLWGPEDRKAYLKAMLEKVSMYLQEAGEA